MFIILLSIIVFGESIDTNSYDSPKSFSYNIKEPFPSSKIIRDSRISPKVLNQDKIKSNETIYFKCKNEAFVWS